jgi:hypothetical protein
MPRVVSARADRLRSLCKVLFAAVQCFSGQLVTIAMMGVIGPAESAPTTITSIKADASSAWEIIVLGPACSRR